MTYKRVDGGYSSWTGDILRQKRMLANMTQTQMATSLGISPRMYGYYESGHTPIDKKFELAVRHLAIEEGGQKEQLGSLTDWDKTRIRTLCDGIENATEDVDKGSHLFKILYQSSKEFHFLLSKFED
tara:strand:- start:325 stop:705 length:381 start_codon:yes stop_codon:yes gene_type:complete